MLASPANDLCRGRQPNNYICENVELIEGLCDREPESAGSAGVNTVSARDWG